MKTHRASLFFAASITLMALPSMALASSNSSQQMTLEEAKRVINAYRELRDSCAEGNFDARRACVNQLSHASEDYRAAKDVISGARLSVSTPNSKPIAAFN